MNNHKIPRCQIVPDADQQVAITIDGSEVMRWHFGHHYPRPFFHPVIGPSGANLVRMGHPGAPNHDHHSGLWFAHNTVESFNFWANGTGAQIRQKQWLDYIDSEEYAAMAVRLEYFDGHEEDALLEQDTITVVRPLENDEYLIELGLHLKSRQGPVTLKQTNFGLVAVRVAATVSEHFGGGTITNATGAQNEKNIFGLASKYMDYSGPVRTGIEATEINGITLFDHQSNFSYPSKWHVREDGWMGPSINRDKAYTIDTDRPLQLRYLLHVHDGPFEPAVAERQQDEFNLSAGWRVEKSTKKHRAWEILSNQ